MTKVDGITNLLKDCSVITKFINNHLKVRTYYVNDIRPQFGISQHFALPVETRFYTYYTFGESILANKTGLRYLVEEKEEEVKTMVRAAEYANFEKVKEIVTKNAFWSNLKFVVEKLLQPAKELIAKFEADSYQISDAYADFQRVFHYYKQIPKNVYWKPEKIAELFRQNWHFVHTNAMGIARILSPKHYGREMEESDFEDSLQEV